MYRSTSDDIIFKETGKAFLDLGVCPGRGAVLYNKAKKRFVDELLPRDVVTKAIREQMEKDGTESDMASMEKMDKTEILKHFPNIYKHCLEEGYDVTKECIPSYRRSTILWEVSGWTRTAGPPWNGYSL